MSPKCIGKLYAVERGVRDRFGFKKPPPNPLLGKEGECRNPKGFIRALGVRLQFRFITKLAPEIKT